MDVFLCGSVFVCVSADILDPCSFLEMPVPQQGGRASTSCCPSPMEELEREARSLCPVLPENAISYTCMEGKGGWLARVTLRLYAQPVEFTGMLQGTPEAAKADAARSAAAVLRPPKTRKAMGSLEPWEAWGCMATPHWCCWLSTDFKPELWGDGLARAPERTSEGHWRVWCACGALMQLVPHAPPEVLYTCFCGGPAPSVWLPGPRWTCHCGLTHQAEATGAPLGVPCTHECRQLRALGHRLLDAVGPARGAFLLNAQQEGAFHFSRAGLQECLAAIALLLQILQAEGFFHPVGPPPLYPVLWPTD